MMVPSRRKECQKDVPFTPRQQLQPQPLKRLRSPESKSSSSPCDSSGASRNDEWRKSLLGGTTRISNRPCCYDGENHNSINPPNNKSPVLLSKQQQSRPTRRRTIRPVLLVRRFLVLLVVPVLVPLSKQVVQQHSSSLLTIMFHNYLFRGGCRTVDAALAIRFHRPGRLLEQAVFCYHDVSAATIAQRPVKLFAQHTGTSVNTNTTGSTTTATTSTTPTTRLVRVPSRATITTDTPGAFFKIPAPASSMTDTSSSSSATSIPMVEAALEDNPTTFAPTTSSFGLPFGTSGSLTVTWTPVHYSTTADALAWNFGDHPRATSPAFLRQGSFGYGVVSTGDTGAATQFQRGEALLVQFNTSRLFLPTATRRSAPSSQQRARLVFSIQVHNNEGLRIYRKQQQVLGNNNNPNTNDNNNTTTPPQGVFVKALPSRFPNVPIPLTLVEEDDDDTNNNINNSGNFIRRTSNVQEDVVDFALVDAGFNGDGSLWIRGMTIDVEWYTDDDDGNDKDDGTLSIADTVPNQHPNDDTDDLDNTLLLQQQLLLPPPPPRFNPIFTDHMVLQRNQPVSVYGTAAPGAKLVLSFGVLRSSSAPDANTDHPPQPQNDDNPDIQRIWVTADPTTGEWQAVLKAMPASYLARALQIATVPDEIVDTTSSSSSRTVPDSTAMMVADTIVDVLVGDVFLCGGQSNMNRPFRLYKTLNVVSTLEKDSASSSSNNNTADTNNNTNTTKAPAANMSAIRIVSIRSNAVPLDAIPTVADAQRVEIAVAEEWGGKWRSLGDAAAGTGTGGPSSGGGGGTDTNNNGNGKSEAAFYLNEFSPAAYFASFKLQTALDIPIGMVLSAQGASKVEEWMSEDSLRQALNEYTNADNNDAANDQSDPGGDPGGSPGNHNPASSTSTTVGSGTDPNHLPPLLPQGHTELYNGMIYPLRKSTFAAILWYQGETNTFEPRLYKTLFRTMIAAWRDLFQTSSMMMMPSTITTAAAARAPPLPFYFAQLSSIQKPRWDDTDQAWAFFRESQAAAVDAFAQDNDDGTGNATTERTGSTTGNTHMIVTYDVGEFNDIHPQDKQTVGERFALAILSQDDEFVERSNNPSLDGTSPTFKDSQVTGSHMVVTFENKGNRNGSIFLQTRAVTMNRNADLPPRSDPRAFVTSATVVEGFEICDMNQVFVPAQATIVGADRIVVSSEHVPSPVAVRYCWKSFGLCNVYSSTSGLPLAPFRTDNFELPDLDGLIAGDVFLNRDIQRLGDPMEVSTTKGSAVVSTVIRDGLEGYLVVPSASSTFRDLYLTTTNPAFKNGPKPYVLLRILYFDQGTGSIRFRYDSVGAKTEGVGNNIIALSNSREWRVAELALWDAYFGNRLVGYDLRLQSSDDDFLIGGVFLSGPTVYTSMPTDFPSTPSPVAPISAAPSGGQPSAEPSLLLSQEPTVASLKNGKESSLPTLVQQSGMPSAPATITSQQALKLPSSMPTTTTTATTMPTVTGSPTTSRRPTTDINNVPPLSASSSLRPLSAPPSSAPTATAVVTPAPVSAVIRSAPTAEAPVMFQSIGFKLITALDSLQETSSSRRDME